MNCDEVWKPIDESNGNYEVSNFGRIRTRKRQGTDSRFLRPYVAKNGYKMVALRINGKYRTTSVHRLVALAFVPNPNNLPCINHKDENKENNDPDNLEWCTIQYNNNYGTAKMRASITRHKPCEGIWPDGTVRRFNSCTIAAKETGLTQGNIWNACNHGHKAGGASWRYV